MKNKNDERPPWWVTVLVVSGLIIIIIFGAYAKQVAEMHLGPIP